MNNDGSFEWHADVIDAQELARKEYEALQAEKLARINARLAIWSIFLTLVGAFGFAGVQSSDINVLVALYPVLVSCLARHAGHNEAVLTQVKHYLFRIERLRGYVGYEHFNRRERSFAHGSHLKALRDAFVLTEVLAVGLLIWRLIDHSWYWAIAVVLVIELLAMVMTVLWLRDR